MKSPDSNPAPFDQGWTLGDTREHLGRERFPTDGTPAEQEAWRCDIGHRGSKKLARAIGSHVAHLIQDGHGVMPEHCEGINTWFIHHLRELAANPDNGEFQIAVGEPFERHMETVHILNPDKYEINEVDRIHQDLVELIKAGDFKSVLSDDQVCHNTGLRINVRFKHWDGVAGTNKHVQDPDRPWGRFAFEPLDPANIPVLQTYTHTIPVPSGMLWISDWFRIDAFNALTRVVDEQQPHDAMDSTQGLANISRCYAKQLGVAHVFCKSPDIVSSMGAITAGKCHEHSGSGDAIRPKGHIGKIEADLRWTTVVDRQHLVELLASKIGREAAMQQVDDYEANHRDIIKVQVEPGQHHLYFAGDGRVLWQTIGTQFASEGLFLDEDYREPGFALTQDPLPDLAAKPTRRSKPARGS